MTITISWWMVPTIFTILCFGLAWYGEYHDSKNHRGDMYGDMFGGIVMLIVYGGASIISLISWVIYLALVP